MKKEKALIHIGAGPLQRATLTAAREAGLYVVATDARVDAASAEMADEFRVIRGDDSTALLALAEELKTRLHVVGAYAGSDFGLIPVARIHEVLGLHGSSPTTVLHALDKYRSKEVFLSAGVETPQGWLLDSPDAVTGIQGCTPPLIVKPVDSCGSQGVTSVDHIADLPAAVGQAFTHSSRVVVEELFEGVGIDTIGIVWDGRFIPCGIGTRIFSAKPYHFPLYGYTPPDLAPAEIDYAYNLTGRAARALGINFSPVKADLLYRDGTFTVLEVTPRFHGDVFSSMMIPFSCGIAPARILFEMMAGRMVSLPPPVGSRLVLWRALFPLSGSVDFVDVRQRLANRWQLLSFYFDPARLKKISCHCDNTSLVGFFWVELDSLVDLSAFHADFYQQFGGKLL